MRWRRTIAASAVACGTLLLGGCQWLLPDRGVPGVQHGPTFEAATPAPTLPIIQASEAPRVSPSLEIPPPID